MKKTLIFISLMMLFTGSVWIGYAGAEAKVHTGADVQDGKIRVGIFPFTPDRGVWHKQVVLGIGDFLFFHKNNRQTYSVASFYNFDSNSNVTNSLKAMRGFTKLDRQSLGVNTNSTSLKDYWIKKGAFLRAQIMPNTDLITGIAQKNNIDLIIMGYIDVQTSGWVDTGRISLFLMNPESGEAFSKSVPCDGFLEFSREISFKLTKELFSRLN